MDILPVAADRLFQLPTIRFDHLQNVTHFQGFTSVRVRPTNLSASHCTVKFLKSSTRRILPYLIVNTCESTADSTNGPPNNGHAA